VVAARALWLPLRDRFGIKLLSIGRTPPSRLTSLRWPARPDSWDECHVFERHLLFLTGRALLASRRVSSVELLEQHLAQVKRGPGDR
jgi:hypothetical protein